MKRLASGKLRTLVALAGGILIPLVVVVSFWLYGSWTEKAVFQRNSDTCRLLVDQVLLIHHWENLESDRRFEPLTQDLTRRLSRHEYESRFIRPHSSARDREPKTPLEERLLESFAQRAMVSDGNGPQAPDFYERLVEGGSRYEYYQPIYAEDSCAGCHSAIAGEIDKFGSPLGGADASTARLAEGDLMAIVQVTIPNQPMLAALNQHRKVLVALAIVTAIITAVLTATMVFALRLTNRPDEPPRHQGAPAMHG
ncbi:MAG: DUF3365 domain-containing protein [Thermoguttaceae bacterium]|jgi:hypothetical protein|nr:DUF3365 domain-containing protein [Thermoguttaceae bacterium]